MRGVITTAAEEKTRILIREMRHESPGLHLLMRVLGPAVTGKLRLFNGRIARPAWQATAKRGNEWAELVSHVLDRRMAPGSDVERTLKRLTWFIQELTDVALLEEMSTTPIVVHDESLLQRGLSLGFDTEDGDIFLRRYVELAPASSAVILVSVPFDVAFQRIEWRARSDAMLHRRILPQAYTRAEHVAEILEARGIPVVRVDGLQPPEVNAELVLNLIGNLLD